MAHIPFIDLSNFKTPHTCLLPVCVLGNFLSSSPVPVLPDHFLFPNFQSHFPLASMWLALTNGMPTAQHLGLRDISWFHLQSLTSLPSSGKESTSASVMVQGRWITHGGDLAYPPWGVQVTGSTAQSSAAQPIKSVSAELNSWPADSWMSSVRSTTLS
jgi:hypothetical protein